MNGRLPWVQVMSCKRSMQSPPAIAVRCLDRTPSTASEDGVRPFIKWAGGKRQLLPALIERVPANHGTYFEPFLGAERYFSRSAPDGRSSRM